MKHLFFLFFLFALTACAGPKPTQLDVELERYRMTAVAECYKSKVPTQAFAADPKDQALLMLAEALANQNKPDICAQIAGMNAHEARAKIAEAQNNALGATVSSVVKGATAITGIIVGGDVIKSGMKNSGTTVNGDSNIMGPDNSRTATSYSYDMHTETVE